MMGEDLLKELSEKGLKTVVNKPKKKDLLLNDRYILGDKIGEGGLSIVYKASDIYCDFFKDNREIVIKMPSKELATKIDIAAFFYSEYSILIGLKHESIVRVLDFGIDDDKQLPYIVMEKIDGDLLVNISLHKITKNMKIKFAMSLYNALSYIHSKDIIHADINPTNIVMSWDGKASIFDFGISQSAKVKKHFFLSNKKTNAYNPIYSAPEIHNGEIPSKKTDLFSLACVLYELYAKELPFKINSLELRNAPLTRKQLVKIPFLQRSWFKNALEYDSEKRLEKIPFCVRFKYFIDQNFD